MKEFGREVFCHLFNTLWHKELSDKVIFQLSLITTYKTENLSRIIVHSKILHSTILIHIGETIQHNRSI